MIIKLIRLFLTVAFLVAMYVLPASAQTTKAVKFYMWLDSPANTYFDYWTGDYCLGGDTLIVYKLGSGLQPWFYMYATHGDNPVYSSGNSLILDCKNNSSAWYTMALGDYKIVGGNPSYITYFSIVAGGTTQLVGHKVLSWSGE